MTGTRVYAWNSSLTGPPLTWAIPVALRDRDSNPDCQVQSLASCRLNDPELLIQYMCALQ